MGPLAGILVADFSRVLAGPLAAMLLGDLGADVELARRLAQRADVLVESFRPGLMARWGLDGETLRAANPGLVTCSVTAFGTESDAARALPGYDFLAQAMGGLMS